MAMAEEVRTKVHNNITEERKVISFIIIIETIL